MIHYLLNTKYNPYEFILSYRILVFSWVKNKTDEMQKYFDLLEVYYKSTIKSSWYKLHSWATAAELQE